MNESVFELMAKKERRQLQRLGELLISTPFDHDQVADLIEEVFSDSFAVLDFMDTISKKAGLSIGEMCKALNINKTSYFRRMRENGYWTKEEILLLPKIIRKAKSKKTEPSISIKKSSRKRK
jgi:hypothetical protein